MTLSISPLIISVLTTAKYIYHCGFDKGWSRREFQLIQGILGVIWVVTDIQGLGLYMGLLKSTPIGLFSEGDETT